MMMDSKLKRALALITILAVSCHAAANAIQPAGADGAKAEDPFSLPIEAVSTSRQEEQPQISEAEAADLVRQVDAAMAASGASADAGGAAAPAATQEPELPAQPQMSYSIGEDGVPVVTGGDGTQDAAPTEAFERDPITDKLRAEYKITQTVNMGAGEGKLIPVGAGVLNRIETPFKNATYSTSSPKEDALIVSEGGYIFVTPLNGIPFVDLMIEEKGAPETAVYLTLAPIDVPGSMVRVNIGMSSGAKDAQQVAIERASEERKRAEEQVKQDEREKLAKEAKTPDADGHVDRVMTLLTGVAKAEIPQGYELIDDVAYEYRFPCDLVKLGPLYHEVKQRLIGSKEVIDVMLIKNDVNGLATFYDEACQSEDVIAVGVLDVATLMPGESAEVYILRDRFYWDKKAAKPKRRRITE